MAVLRAASLERCAGRNRCPHALPARYMVAVPPDAYIMSAAWLKSLHRRNVAFAAVAAATPPRRRCHRSRRKAALAQRPTTHRAPRHGAPDHQVGRARGLPSRDLHRLSASSADSSASIARKPSACENCDEPELCRSLRQSSPRHLDQRHQHEFLRQFRRDAYRTRSVTVSAASGAGRRGPDHRRAKAEM